MALKEPLWIMIVFPMAKGVETTKCSSPVQRQSEKQLCLLCILF